jgi:plastocyanin
MSVPVKTIIFLVVLGLLFAPGPVGKPSPVVQVRGTIELINAQIKGRDGRVDASGIVVWLDPLEGGAARGGRNLRRVMTQRGKRFIPHVLAVETGSEIEFPNEDPFFHNVFSIYDGRRFDLGLYASGETRPVTFNRPGISYIFCNIHPQMSAVVIALETPYYALSDGRGVFNLAGVPDGRYRLQFWHERATAENLGKLSRTVQIGGGNLDLGLIQISEEGYIPRQHTNKHGEEYDPRRNRPAYRKP